MASIAKLLKELFSKVTKNNYKIPNLDESEMWPVVVIGRTSYGSWQTWVEYRDSDNTRIVYGVSQHFGEDRKLAESIIELKEAAKSSDLTHLKFIDRCVFVDDEGRKYFRK